MSALKNLFAVLWHEVFVFRYKREVMIALGAVLVLLAGYGLYRYSAAGNELRAHRAFVESYELYDAAMGTEAKDGAKRTSLLQEAEMAFDTGYKQYSGTSLAPYFLALHAEVLAQQGKIHEALGSLNKVLAHMSSRSPLYDFYELKRSLMKLDSDDASLKAQGVEQLQAMALKSASVSRGAAMYYLGEYYVSTGDKAKAKDVFEKLVAAHADDERAGFSAWVSQAKSKLEYLS